MQISVMLEARGPGSFSLKKFSLIGSKIFCSKLPLFECPLVTISFYNVH